MDGVTRLFYYIFIPKSVCVDTSISHLQTVYRQECYELSQAKSRVRIAAAIRDTVLPPAGERGKLTDEAVVAEARLVLRYVRWTIRVGPCLTGRYASTNTTHL